MGIVDKGFARLVRTISLSLLNARGSLTKIQIQRLLGLLSFTEPKIGTPTVSETVGTQANSGLCQSALIERFHRSHFLYTSTQFPH